MASIISLANCYRGPREFAGANSVRGDFALRKIFSKESPLTVTDIASATIGKNYVMALGSEKLPGTDPIVVQGGRQIESSPPGAGVSMDGIQEMSEKSKLLVLARAEELPKTCQLARYIKGNYSFYVYFFFPLSSKRKVYTAFRFYFREDRDKPEEAHAYKTMDAMGDFFYLSGNVEMVEIA
jgi:hypothetical protein